MVEVTLDKKAIGQRYKKTAAVLMKHLESYDEKQVLELQQILSQGFVSTVEIFTYSSPTTLKLDQEEFEITPAMVTFKKVQKRVSGSIISKPLNLDQANKLFLVSLSLHLV